MPKRTITQTVPLVTATNVPRSANEKLEFFHHILMDTIRNRMEALRDEAETIGNDMQALVGRLEDKGSEAELSDIRSARWYRTSAQLVVLQRLWKAWSELTGKKDLVQMSPAESSYPDDEAEVESGGDE